MEKRLHQFSICLMLVLAVGWSTQLHASTLIDGLYYDLNSKDKTAVLTSNGNASSDYASLTDVKIPSAVTYGGISYTVVSIKSNAFTNCSGLTSISIPATVTVVDYGSFNGCKGLKNVTLEDGNAPLLLQCHYENRTLGYGQTGSGLFHSCSIENLYIGRNIVEDSIRGNKWIYRFPYEYGYSPFYDNASITRVTIGNKVTDLPAYLFYGISGISTMELPHVKKIGAHCFDGAAKMTTLSLGDALTHVGDYAFKGCSNLTNLAFPTTTKLLGEGAFYDCNTITSTSFANGCQLDSIDSLCFYNCYALTAFKCPKTVSYIGNSAFENCKKLVTIVLGEKMTAINKATFKGDVALSEMTVNEGVTSIYDEAFYNCEGIAVYSLPQSLITI